ncbi:MAG: hypothetical protein MJY56_04465 [Bacteroidales bacterium]|nr:hypothetical protein [Bacteroidales bacterium]
MNMLYSIVSLLYYQSTGEALIIGGMTGLATTLIIWLISRRSKKKEAEEAKQKAVENSLSIKKAIARDFDEDPDSIRSVANTYSRLYDDLKRECNPANFMNPYDAEKVAVANSIYSRLDAGKHDNRSMIALRNEAISKLHLFFRATALCNRLSSIFNPERFMGDNYNAAKLAAANEVYSLIQSKRDDIQALEKICSDLGIPLRSSASEVINNKMPEKTAADIQDDKADAVTLVIGLIIGFASIVLFIVALVAR